MGGNEVILSKQNGSAFFGAKIMDGLYLLICIMFINN